MKACFSCNAAHFYKVSRKLVSLGAPDFGSTRNGPEWSMGSEVNRADRVTDGTEVHTQVILTQSCFLWKSGQKPRETHYFGFHSGKVRTMISWLLSSSLSPRSMTAWDNVQDKANGFMCKAKAVKEGLGSACWRCPKQDRRRIPALPLICSFNILRMFFLGQVPKACMSRAVSAADGEQQNLSSSETGHHPTLSLNEGLSFILSNYLHLKLQGATQILAVLTNV